MIVLMTKTKTKTKRLMMDVDNDMDCVVVFINHQSQCIAFIHFLVSFSIIESLINHQSIQSQQQQQSIHSLLQSFHHSALHLHIHSITSTSASFQSIFSFSHTQKNVNPSTTTIIFDTSISTSNPISLLFNILSCFNSLFINNHSNLSSTIHSIMVSCAFCLQSIQSHSPLQNLITCVFNFTSNPIPSTHNTTHTCLFTSIHSSLHLPHTHVSCNVAVHATFISFLVFHNQCPTAFPFVHPNIHITLPLSTSFILMSVSPSFKLCNDFCFSPALF